MKRLAATFMSLSLLAPPGTPKTRCHSNEITVETRKIAAREPSVTSIIPDNFGEILSAAELNGVLAFARVSGPADPAHPANP